MVARNIWACVSCFLYTIWKTSQAYADCGGPIRVFLRVSKILKIRKSQKCGISHWARTVLPGGESFWHILAIWCKPSKSAHSQRVAGDRQKLFGLCKFLFTHHLKEFAGLYRLRWSNSSVPKDPKFWENPEIPENTLLRAFTKGNPIAIWSRFRIFGKCHCTQGRKISWYMLEKYFSQKK